MQDLNDKINDGGATADGQLSADEWNQVPSEVQNVIESLGIALSVGDLNQLGKAIAGYSVNGAFYTDSGAADAYVLSPQGGKQSVQSYTEGSAFIFIPSNTNSGASTAIIGAVGTIDIKAVGGVIDPATGDIEAGVSTTLIYRGSPSAHFELQYTNKSMKAGRKNLLIGNFRINQRAVTGTVVLGAGVYGHDRFRGGSGGCTYTFATVAGVTTITISAGTLEQEIEGSNIESADYILSWGGTSQAQIDGGGFGDSGEVTDTLVGGANSICEWDTGTVSLPQMEKGSVATEFERRPTSDEEALCKRYYESGRSAHFTTPSDLGTTDPVRHFFKTNKRIIPAMTFSNFAGLLNCTGVTEDDISIDSFSSTTHISGRSSGSVNTRARFDWTADSEL